jgi:hypothetical protein
MVKTRNVVEAGIIVALIGVPVMSLRFTLTARIIILCLTALPLGLLALVGVSGMSLSAFILQFFGFLKNRRVLSREEPPKSALRSRRAGKRCAEAEAPRRRSRSRVRIDLKKRTITHYKTFA